LKLGLNGNSGIEWLGYGVENYYFKIVLCLMVIQILEWPGLGVEK
jgi:hypothetical protein